MQHFIYWCGILNNVLKRFFDFMASASSIVLLLPVFLIAAVKIKLDSVGPIILRQERLGLHGKKFVCYKFRTMVENAEEEGPRISTERDSRQTRIGRFLRRYYLDELPQLWNIFVGEMSFVGPRPEREIFHKQFVKEIPKWAERLKVKPGLTGLAQVMGKSSINPKEKIKYDLQYIKEQNLLLDFKILTKQFLILFERLAKRIKLKLKI